MSKMTLSIVRDDGKTMAVNGTLWDILAAEGLDKPEISVFTQKAAVGDGDIVTGKRVRARSISLTIKTPNSSLNEVLRRAATSYFTPAHTFDLYVSRYGAQRYAPACEIEGFEIPTEKRAKPITAKIDLLCPEGYFLSVDDFAQNLAGIEPRAGYPFVSTADIGRIYGLYSFAETVDLTNDGDAEAYCKAVFVAKGDVTNPKLIAGSGYVRILGAMASGDTLIIDGRTKGVTLNGANIATQIDKASSFDGITFAIGQNSVGFAADVGANLLDVYVYYNKRYMGA
jgi:phage-related protein